MDYKNIFSTRLKQLRIDNKITLSQLGSSVGLSKGSLSDIENAKVFISFDKAIAIANHFNVSLDYLVGRDFQASQNTDKILTEKEGEAMSNTGEKPGKGVYTCTKCGQTVVLDDTTDTLPPCPSCKGTNFRP